MGENQRVVNGRLLLSGQPRWWEYDAQDLLDIAEALVEEEARFRVTVGISVKDLLPDVDMSVPVVLSGALSLLPYEAPAPADDEGGYDPESDPLFVGSPA